MKQGVALGIILLGVFLFLIAGPLNTMYEKSIQEKNVVTQNNNSTDEPRAEAYLAGGCFWCMEAAFEALEGVKEVVSGYTGGTINNPTYKEVTTGNTGHYEAVKIVYDPTKITYEEIITYFWNNIDPFDNGGQFTDRGEQYRTAIFYANKKELEIANKSKEILAADTKRIVYTDIIPLQEFFEAEEYHQDFYKKRTAHYESYTTASGRKNKLKELWSKTENN
jgi:methionine-S-sulfoxide reductase